MAKRFRLRISRFISPFQTCRSKDPSSFPEKPIPLTFRQSPTNPKPIDIDFPTSKSRHSSFKHQVSSAIVSVGCGCRSRSSRQYATSDNNPDTPEFSWEKEDKWHVVARVYDETPRRKIYNSSASGDSDGDLLSTPAMEKKKKKNQRDKKKKPKSRFRTSTSSADSGWFSSSEGIEEIDDEETETLVSSSRSFSTDYSTDFNPHLETIKESSIHGSRRSKKKNKLKRVKRVKRYTSKSKIRGTTSSSTEIDSPARLSVFRRLIPCTMDGKVKESFAVVKKSEDPYEDFKRSMLEMILEKQMFAQRDLEQLLHCFLSLNAPQHHVVIVEAFSEIWEVLFCSSPATQLV